MQSLLNLDPLKQIVVLQAAIAFTKHILTAVFFLSFILDLSCGSSMSLTPFVVVDFSRV